MEARRVGRTLGRSLLVLLLLSVAAMAAWSWAIGPRAVGRVLAHGTTTVWDHLAYPGRTVAATDPQPWARSTDPAPGVTVTLPGRPGEPLDALLARTRTLAFVVIDGPHLRYEWYAPGHGPEQRSMLFSVSKSVLSLLVGAALDDGLLASVDDPVTDYVPELAPAGFDRVSIEDLLHMDSGLEYVEDDNPFGIHVEFNYTADLTGDILGLGLRDVPDEVFRYKSGDNALLGLVLTRALGDGVTVSAYLQERLWGPLGAETDAVWVTDDTDGLERTWCCLATSARDLARLGVLARDAGLWEGRTMLSEAWLEASFAPAYDASRWPDDYADGPLQNYGYQWWLTHSGQAVALGKDGQYLVVDRARDLVLVRLGDGIGGDFSWLAVLDQVAEAMATAGR